MTLDEIKTRYFRPVIAFPQGAIVHRGDCTFWSFGFCDCGLLSDLAVLNPGKVMEAYPNYYIELAKHEGWFYGCQSCGLRRELLCRNCDLNKEAD